MYRHYKWNTWANLTNTDNSTPPPSRSLKIGKTLYGHYIFRHCFGLYKPVICYFSFFISISFLFLGFYCQEIINLDSIQISMIYLKFSVYIWIEKTTESKT